MLTIDDIESVGAGREPRVTAVMAEWSAEEPGIRIGDDVAFVTHRPLEDGGDGPPARARYKVHAAALGDHTKLVTLIIHLDGESGRGLHETLVSTLPAAGGKILARGVGHRDQPMILVFKLDSAPASLASA